MEFYSESDVFKIQYVVSFEIQGISRSLVLRILFFYTFSSNAKSTSVHALDSIFGRVAKK